MNYQVNKKLMKLLVMQINLSNSEKIDNTSSEAGLDTLIPSEMLGIIFDRVINQSQPLRDISSLLLTCQKWKGVLEENPCIALVQALFQLKGSHQFAITHLQECIITEQKKDFTPQELKLIDRAQGHRGKRFEKLLMIDSCLFQSKSLFLFLLDRYPWDPEVCKKSPNKNIQQIAEEQVFILRSLTSGTDDQRLTLIKNDFIEKIYQGCRGKTWWQAEMSIISTLKKFPNFNDKKIFIKIAHCFGSSVFDINKSLKKEREVVLAAIQQNGNAFRYADTSLKKDREFVLAAVKQNGWAFAKVNESFTKDREIVLAAVQQDGRVLQFADKSFKKDQAIVLAAVQQNGEALIYADESLKKDRDIVLAAVQEESWWVIQYANLNLQIELSLNSQNYKTLYNRLCKLFDQLTDKR